MVEKAKKSMIGLFVSGAIVLLIGGIYILSPNLFSKDKFTFVCYFSDSLKGLSVGSNVYLMGVPVGRVESVDIGDPLNINNYSAPVMVSLNKGNIFLEAREKTFFNQDDANEVMESYIRKGLVAQLESQSLLTGQLSVELSFKNGKGTTIEPKYIGDTLQIPTAQERLSAVWEKVSEVPFVQIGQDVETLLSNVNILVSSMESMLEQIDMPKLSQEVFAMLQSLNESSQTLNSILKNNEKGVEKFVTSFGTLSQNSNQLVKSLTKSTSADSVLLVQLSETLKALEAASKAIAQMANLLEIKPDALIFGK